MMDMHCHVDLYKDPQSVLMRANNAGIYVLSVTTTPKAWVGTAKIAKGFRRVKTALGLHPQIAHERLGELDLFERLIQEVEYIGEIGLDRTKLYEKYYDEQLYAFRRIVELLANNGGKPMSIHSRNAVDDVIDVLESYPNAGHPILHWFSGSMKQLERSIQLGCWFSVGPKMLVTEKGRNIIKKIPLDRILLETDGPFTRQKCGELFEPIHTLGFIEKIGEIKGIEEFNLKLKLSENLRNLVA